MASGEIYEPLAAEVPLSQGDILDDCPVSRLIELPAEGGSGCASIQGLVRVVVLTQACDLAQAKTSKAVVAILHEARGLVERGVLKAAFIRDNLRRGQVFGWYFLPAAPAPVGLPESIVDLHELHTIPRPVLERIIADGKRICRVRTPYREHLAQHFAVTYMRIGLPEPYETEP
jgi:hypothetical protein